jgi:hypothetical protein
MKKTEINFRADKDTKNTIRFAEVVANELDATKVGAIYVNKAVLKEMGYAQGMSLKVTIELTK